jgi:hypothetical protein
MLQVQAARQEFLCSGPGSLIGYRKYEQPAAWQPPATRPGAHSGDGTAVVGVLQLGNRESGKAVLGRLQPADEPLRVVAMPDETAAADGAAPAEVSPSSVGRAQVEEAAVAEPLITATSPEDGLLRLEEDGAPGEDGGGDAISAGLTIMFSSSQLNQVGNNYADRDFVDVNMNLNH